MNTFHPGTLATLEYQSRRMRRALETKERKEVEAVHRRVDQILDERPRPVGLAPDGEVIWDNGSPWVQDQAAVAINETSKPERMLDPSRWPNLPMSMFGPLDEDGGPDGPEPNGGVGLLDRP